MNARILLGVALLAAIACSGCGDSRTGRAQAATPAPADAASAVRAMARGNVEVPGGLVEIGAPLDGVVDSVGVKEGDSVKRGQLLLQLAGDAQRHELALAQSELELARVRHRSQQARLPAAATQAKRMAEAARAEAIDAQRADDAQQALRDIEAAVAVARAEVVVAEQKLAQARGQAARLAVRAAEDASVVRLQTQPGARVSAQAGRPLMTLLPARALQIRAEVNESFVPRIVLGMKASVRLDADASGASQGALPEAKVVRISPVFGSSRLDDEAQARGRVRVVDCFLEFDRAPPLRVGQAVRVEFHD